MLAASGNWLIFDFAFLILPTRALFGIFLEVGAWRFELFPPLEDAAGGRVFLYLLKMVQPPDSHTAQSLPRGDQEGGGGASIRTI